MDNKISESDILWLLNFVFNPVIFLFILLLPLLILINYFGYRDSYFAWFFYIQLISMLFWYFIIPIYSNKLLKKNELDSNTFRSIIKWRIIFLVLFLITLLIYLIWIIEIGLEANNDTLLKFDYFHHY